MNLDDSSGRILRFLDRMLVPPSEKIARQVGDAGRSCCADAPVPTLSPGVLWEGVFQGWSGYAKANRELLFRTANHLYVQIVHALRTGSTDEATDLRLSAHEKTRVARSCPFLRFFGPDAKHLPGDRKKIVFTMMETEVVHPDMVDLINGRFDELWTPTNWGLEAFRRSGVAIPSRAVPLGVDSSVYRPIPGARLPACALLSRGGSREKEIPEGFLFLSVGLPSFRKGFDLLCDAFEEAFSGRDDVALVCAVTHSTANVEALSRCAGMKSRIYALEGSFDEHRMARIYSSCNAYVSASRGEGWNLPMCEAAACGLPVIIPRNTTHPEVSGGEDCAFLFDPEGLGPCPSAEAVSPWYKGMPFSVFGKRSRGQLVGLLRHVERDRADAQRKASRFRHRVITELAWESGAETITRRLLEEQG